MDYSAANTQLWNMIIQTGIIGLIVIISNILRLKIPFVKKSLMPTAVLSGFLLLALRYTGLVKIDTNLLEMITYHTIAIGFIALSLRVSDKGGQTSSSGVGTAFKSGALIVSTYLIQAVAGLIISIGLAYTFMPGLFKASGLLLPMGYGQGPGQANNIGSTYEKLGFTGGHSYGVAIAATGFLVACIVGVIYLNIGQRKGKFSRIQHEDIKGSVITTEVFQDQEEAPVSQSIDRLSIQCALVLGVYIITYLVTKLITWLLSTYAPGVASLLNSMLWGFNFIFGSLFAVIVRAIISKFRKTNVMKLQYQNNYLLSRISGLAFDVMIICGIATINFEDLSGLWIPFAITAVVGGLVTFLHLKFLCKKIYPGYEEEGFISMFGMLTGTISSGILLVREIDPDFKTPAGNNLVTGSSTAILFGAPVLILVGMAPKSTAMTFIVFGIVLAYLLILDLIILLKKK